MAETLNAMSASIGSISVVVSAATNYVTTIWTVAGLSLGKWSLAALSSAARTAGFATALNKSNQEAEDVTKTILEFKYNTLGVVNERRWRNS